MGLGEPQGSGGLDVDSLAAGNADIEAQGAFTPFKNCLGSWRAASFCVHFRRTVGCSLLADPESPV